MIFEVFKPMIFGNVKNFTFVIYNRFGQKVFEKYRLIPRMEWQPAWYELAKKL